MTRDEFAARARKWGVPDHLVEGLGLYFLNGLRPGHFLTAVLENDLMGAMRRGDDRSRAGLSALCAFIATAVPADAWGSPERVSDWVRVHREASESGAPR